MLAFNNSILRFKIQRAFEFWFSDIKDVFDNSLSIIVDPIQIMQLIQKYEKIILFREKLENDFFIRFSFFNLIQFILDRLNLKIEQLNNFDKRICVLSGFVLEFYNIILSLNQKENYFSEIEAKNFERYLILSVICKDEFGIDMYSTNIPENITLYFDIYKQKTGYIHHQLIAYSDEFESVKSY